MQENWRTNQLELAINLASDVVSYCRPWLGTLDRGRMKQPSFAKLITLSSTEKHITVESYQLSEDSDKR